MNESNPSPVLWALSRRSGSLFQAPLLAALNIDGRALAIASRANPVSASAAKSGHLLACPATVTSAGSFFSFATRFVADRRAIASRLRNEGSLVHVTMGCPWDIFYLKAAKQAGLPVVVTLHDATRHPGEEKNIYDRAEPYFMRYADHIVTMSQFVHDEWKGSYAGKAAVHLIEGGLLTQAAPPLAPRDFPHRRPMRLLFLGRLHAYKGLDLLIDALRGLAAKGHTFSLTVAGSGNLDPYRNGLQGLPDVTIINRWIEDDEVRRILAEHDLMVLPYREASQSGVAIDAQWAAMPSVATPVGALTSQFSDGCDALITDCVNEGSVGAAIERLLLDRALYVKLSLGALAAYEQKGIRPVARLWWDFYRQISNDRKGTS
jgi:glycosyltransferase involved in cell wall biosynthesis